MTITTPYFRLEKARSVNPRLWIEVYDWDTIGSDDFLGGVDLDIHDIIDLQRTTLRKANQAGGNHGEQQVGDFRRTENTGVEWVPFRRLNSRRLV